jgi:hypothetical protein
MKSFFTQKIELTIENASVHNQWCFKGSPPWRIKGKEEREL